MAAAPAMVKPGSNKAAMDMFKGRSNKGNYEDPELYLSKGRNNMMSPMDMQNFGGMGTQYPG